jgi:hypothetical protein
MCCESLYGMHKKEYSRRYDEEDEALLLQVRALP